MPAMSAIPPEMISRVVTFFTENSRPDFALLVRLGCATGYRIGDLLTVRVSHVKAGQIELTEQKTKKVRRRPIGASIKRQALKYAIDHRLTDGDFLFPSARSISGHINRSTAYRAIHKAAISLGLSAIGPHSMRKSYALALFARCGNVERVRRDFNHSKTEITMAYLTDQHRALCDHVEASHE